MTLIWKIYKRNLLILLALSILLPTKHASADTVYSVNYNDTVSVISTSDDSVTTPVTLTSGSKPTAICLNPITPRAYTLNSGDNTISVIDTALKTVVETISSIRFTDLVSIACDPTGTRVLIGNNSTANTSNILYLNTATLTLESDDTPVDSNPGSIVFNKNGSRAYILSQGIPSVSVIDTATRQIAVGPMTLAEADAPYALAMHTNDKYLYVVNLLGSYVAFYDPETMSQHTTVNTGIFPSKIVVNHTSNLLYVANSDDTVSLIDPELESLSSTFSADASAALIERNDGQKVYTASMFNNVDSILTYNTANYSATPSQVILPAGSSPQALTTLLGARHNLALTITGDGTGSVNWPFDVTYPLVVDGSVNVPEYINVAVKATAETCSTVDWKGCNSVTGGGTLTAVCSSTPLTGDKHVNAIFTKNIHSVTTAVANGTGNISCLAQICDGTGSACSITSGIGNTLTSLTDNGKDILGDVTNGTSFQIQNIVADHSIVAGFAPIPYTVTASSNINGHISPATSQTVNYGNTASFTLTPSTGYHIGSVGGTCGGTLSGATFTTAAVTADCTVVASFTLNQYQVTPYISSNGSISPPTPQTALHNSSLTFSLSPDAGFSIVSVIGCNGNLSGSIYTTGAITGDCTVSAAFILNTFTVSFTSGGNGSLTGTVSQTVGYAASATSVTAVPATGYHFVNWTGTGGFVASTANPLTVSSVTASQSITANFAINAYTVTPSVVANGSISPTTNQTVNYGSTASFTLAPGTGYHIASVGGTCGGTLSGATFTTAAVSADCTVVASFTVDSYFVMPSASSDGSILPSIQQPVLHGSTTSFTLIPDIGYSIKSVSGCGGSLSGNIYTSAPITGNCSISATFIAIPAVISSVLGGHGSITCSTPAISGDNAGCTITPDIGYHLSSLTDNGVPVLTLIASINSYALNAVTSSHAITASFAAYSLADALQALRIAVGIELPKPGEHLWLDVAPLDTGKPAGNGVIDIMDALVLLKRSIGTYTTW